MYGKRPAFGQVKTIADQPERHLFNAVRICLDQSKARICQSQECVGDRDDRMTVCLRDPCVPVHLALAIYARADAKLASAIS